MKIIARERVLGQEVRGILGAITTANSRLCSPIASRVSRADSENYSALIPTLGVKRDCHLHFVAPGLTSMC